MAVRRDGRAGHRLAGDQGTFQRTLPLDRAEHGQASSARDVVVETMCTVDSEPDVFEDEKPIVPPPMCAAWIRRHVDVQELTVEAAIAGDHAAVHEAMALDPLCGRIDLAGN